MAGKVKKLTEKEARGCIARTQLPCCACRRVNGRIGKDCVRMSDHLAVMLISNTEAHTYVLEQAQHRSCARACRTVVSLARSACQTVVSLARNTCRTVVSLARSACQTVVSLARNTCRTVVSLARSTCRTVG